ncbi:MAG: chemotaxis protein CheW [Myxococcales bacterium]|nr:chemotaxis protein CheW [Myxococcales bacterium]
MAAFETGRRLCLLFEAGGVPYAVEATSVLEVTPPDAGMNRVRGALALNDLSLLMGGQPEVRPGMAVVLDVSPTLAARVTRVFGVMDVARDPHFRLPTGVGDALAALVSGAILTLGRLFLELSADALPARLQSLTAGSAPPLSSPPRPVYLLDEPPERALVFCSQGKLFGIPLAFVSQVVGAQQAFCPMPCQGGPVAGLLPHSQALWPVYSALGLLGGAAAREELCVLTELAGQNVGLCASRVAGVCQGLRPAQSRGEFSAPGLEGPSLFLDLQRMFS